MSRRRNKAVVWYLRDGVSLPDLSPVGPEISEYWGSVFTAPEVNASSDEEFLVHVQVDPPSDWTWSAGRTRAIFAVIRDIAPGPDGLPYARRAAAPDSFHMLLDEIAQGMQ